MEIVTFDFYNYKPRLRISFSMKLHTVPVVGDFIHVPPEYIREISKKLINKESIEFMGISCVVVKRGKYMTSHFKEDWRIELSLVEPLRLK